MTNFPSTRDAALGRLNAFAPKAGQDYARLRNFDLLGHPHVSGLSPYLSHRVVTEEEVLAKTLGFHSASAAEKFIQEVCWRTYWKGVLERRPSLWDRYKIDLQRAWNDIQTQSGKRSEWEDACHGRTGIDPFDHWAKELVETGYLHNHARMWFASIWIFTLRLPWTLGADFFMRHLLDADAASNTLSWRWVAGLQTAGKTYLARPDNIAKYTGNRFSPRGLATFAAPIGDPDLPPLGPAPTSDIGNVQGYALTIDDLSWDSLPNRDLPVAILVPPSQIAPLNPSQNQQDFKMGLALDTQKSLTAKGYSITMVISAEQLEQWMVSQSIQCLGYNHLTQGPARDQIGTWFQNANDLTFKAQVRDYDAVGWSAATAGFFKFKSIIPRLLDGLRQPNLF